MQIRGGGGWIYYDELHDSEFYVRLDDRGRVVELYLTKNGLEITPTDLRQLPLTSIRARDRQRPDLALISEMFPAPDLHAEARRGFPATWISEREQRQEPFELSPQSSAGGLTEAFLADVATAYRDAISRGLRPNKALSQQTGFGKRTVEKWVYLARKKGLLESTRPGRVG